MKKKSSFLSVLLISLGMLISYGQAPEWTRVLQISTYGNQIGEVVTADANNVYMAGSITGTITFGSADLTSIGLRDLIVSRFTNSGSVVWTKQFSANADGIINSNAITTDVAGNIYISCFFQGSVTIGANTITSGLDYNAFLVKISASGTVDWVTGFYSIETTAGKNRIAVDAGGNSYLISRTSKLIKFNSSGTILWEQVYPDKTLLGLVVSGSNLYISGSLRPGMTSFGNIELYSESNNTGYLAKADLNGSFTQVKVESTQSFSSKDGTYHAFGTFIHPTAGTREINLNRILTGSEENVIYTTIADLGTYSMSLTINPDNSVTIGGEISVSQPLYESGANYYDPVNQEFILNYSYDGEGGTRAISEVLTKTGSFVRGESIFSDIAVDQGGNLIITGSFTQNLTLDNFLIKNPSSSYTFIAKCNDIFEFSWIKSSTSTGTYSTANGYNYRVFVDNSNNIYEFGMNSNIPSFYYDINEVYTNNQAFLVKFDPDGNSLASAPIENSTPNWVYISPAGKLIRTGSNNFPGASDFGNLYLKQYSGDLTNMEWQTTSSGIKSGSIKINYVKHDPLGNIYTQSRITGYCDFFGNIINTNIALTAISKQDINGNLLWVRLIPDISPDIFGQAFTLDKDNNVLTVGLFHSVLNIGNTALSSTNNGNEAYVAKYSSNGDFLWAAKMNLNRDIKINITVASDANGNVLVSGVLNPENFLIKFDPNGNQLWSKILPMESYYLSLISTDPDNYIYLTSEIHLSDASGSTTIGSVTLNQTYDDGSIGVFKFDPDGNAVWAKTYGGLTGASYSDGWANDIRTDTAGYTYIWGWCVNNAVFDTYTLSNPIDDGFSYYIMKIDSSGNVKWANAIYENTTGNIYGFNYGALLDFDKTGNVYVGGHFRNTISIDGTTFQPESINDFFVSKFSSNGAFQWIKTIPNNSTSMICQSLSVFSEDVLTIGGAPGYNSTLGTFNIIRKSGTTGIIATLGNLLPASAGPISGTTTVCQGQGSVIYTVPDITNATSYIWTLPSGASGTSTSNSITVNFGISAVSGNITVKGRNSTGDGILSTLPITVNPLPATPETIIGLTTVCQGQNSINYTVPIIANATSYIWALPSGATGTSLTNSINVNYGASAVSGNITVKGNNSCGDGAVSTLPVTVNPFPASAGTISGLTAVCQVQNAVTYTVPAITNATSYVWSLPIGSSGTSTTNSITVNYGVSAVSGNLTVKGANSCGEGAISTLAINVNNKPATPAITLNGSVLHSNAATGNQWYNQNGLIDGAVNQDHMVTTSGEYYTVVTLLGCRSDASNSIPKYFLCDAQFNYSWDGYASFTDMSGGNPTSWSWDFGDGTYSTLQNPSHNYSKDGKYMVKLTIINQSTNCVSSVTREVIAGTGTICKADFTTAMNSLTGLASFTSISENATDYYWKFGDGAYSISANPEHTYTVAGIYHVCLTIWNGTNGCQSEVCKNVIYIPEGVNYVQADFSYFANTTDNAVIFSDMSSSNTTDWYWIMGDGKVLTAQNPVYTYAKPGVYKVCLTAFDKVNGLSKTVCKEIRVGEIACMVGADFSYFINPESREVAFINKSKGSITDYYWTFGDGSASTQENPAHTYSNPGYYLVNLAVRNSNSGCMDMLAQFLQVGSVECRSDFTFEGNPDNTSVSFNDKSKGMIDYYYWEFGDGSYSVLQNPTNLYKKPGMYIVGQTVIDNTNGCMDFSFQPVQVGEINCAADFVSYIDSSSYTGYFTNRILGESTALLWSFGDGRFSTNDNPIHIFPGTGIYSVGLNTFDFNTSCMDYYQEMVMIGGIGNDCEADFIYMVDPTSPEVKFSNMSIGDIVGSIWNFGDGSDNSTETDAVHTYTKGGYYNVCLTVTNSSGIKNMGCKWVLVEGSAVNDCRANFMFSIDSANLKVTFVDNSYGEIDKYNWDFGDSKADSVSTERDPVHTYEQKGYYLVQLKVENTVSGCVSSEYKLLNVAESQVLKASFGYEAREPDKKVAGYPVDLVSASSGDGATVEWDFGDKQVKKESFTVMDSTSRIVTHYYEKSGRYMVCLRISDPVSGQSDTYCSYVFTKNAVGVDEFTETAMNLDVYPNPFIDFTTINYSLPQAQFIELVVFDQLGRRIETLVKARTEGGAYQVIWETKTLTTGVYHLKLISAEGILTKQLVIIR